MCIRPRRRRVRSGAAVSGDDRERAGAARAGRARPQRDLERRPLLAQLQPRGSGAGGARIPTSTWPPSRDKHKDRIVALATSIPGGGDAHLRELERAVKEDGLRGVLISSSHRGAYPDDADARPFFALATALDIPVFVHPPSVGFGEERMHEYRLASSVGRPFDNCLALARLIVAGIFEESALKLVGSHLGGGICEIIGRMDYAYELGDEAFFPGLLRAAADHAQAERLPADDVFRHGELSCARGRMRDQDHRCRPDSPMLLALKQKGLDVIEESLASTTPAGQDRRRHGEKTAQALG